MKTPKHVPRVDILHTRLTVHSWFVCHVFKQTEKSWVVLSLFTSINFLLLSDKTTISTFIKSKLYFFPPQTPMKRRVMLKSEHTNTNRLFYGYKMSLFNQWNTENPFSSLLWSLLLFFAFFFTISWATSLSNTRVSFFTWAQQPLGIVW